MNFTTGGMERAALEYAANAIWQVPLVFAAAWVAARIARRNGPAAEHRVWVAAMLFETVIPACRLELAGLVRGVLAAVFPAAGVDGGAIGIAVGPAAPHELKALQLPEAVFVGIAIAFAASVIYFGARLGWGLWRTEAVRRRARPISLTGEALQVWQRACGDGRTTQIAESAEIPGPVTVGVWRPAVLLPVGFLEGLCADDLEAVLAHERAHVQRWDFAKNLFYEAAWLGVAWHPAVWVTRARLAESREMVCDTMAADAVAGRERYARSLLRLASTVANGASVTPIHAIGIFDATSFERRVMHLTMRRVKMRRLERIGIVAACLVMALATCATAMALRLEIGPGVAGSAALGDHAAPENRKVSVTEMKIISRVPPVYPAEAKANQDTLDGPVVLAVTIGRDGAVQEAHIVKSLRADYDKSALDSVRTWRWSPYTVNGEPVEVDSTVTVNYSIDHDKK